VPYRGNVHGGDFGKSGSSTSLPRGRRQLVTPKTHPHFFLSPRCRQEELAVRGICKFLSPHMGEDVEASGEAIKGLCVRRKSAENRSTYLKRTLSKERGVKGTA